jgi:pSer/pThr/pTyr-binding forkhead associated (FHA) protein
MSAPAAVAVEYGRFEPLRLRVHPGGHAIDLTNPDVVLGRHSEASLCMPLPDVSRRHCRFLHSAAGWELIDLGSLNGVYVNGSRIERVLLRPGDTVRICSLEFEVERAEGDSPAAQSHVIRSIVEAITSPARKAS